MQVAQIVKTQTLMKRYFVLLLAAAGLFASCVREDAEQGIPSQGGNTDQYSDSDVLAGWVRIKMTEEATPLRVGVFTRGELGSGDPELDRLAAELGASEVRRVFPSDPRFEARHRRYGLHLWYDVKFDDSVPVSRAASDFASLPEISNVEPIYTVQLVDEPRYLLPSQMKAASEETTGGEWAGNQREMPFNDPQLKYQWHYDNDGTLPNSLPGADVGLFSVWNDPEMKAGDPSVIVAIMDMGVEATHEDLADNMWVNMGEIPGNGIDDDGNGYIDDVYGYDFYNRTGDITPGSHGTHVAGTVAAVNNNGIGVCGVAGGSGKGDGVRLMTCPLYSSDGGGDNTVAPNAYVYAADNGAVISQNSWEYSAPTITSAPQSLLDAFQYFIDNAGTDADGNQTGPMKGGILVFATGNEYSTAIGIPSNEECVIAVTAMMANYRRALYSNIGPGADLFAPGGSGAQDVDFGTQGKVLSTGWDGDTFVPNSYCWKNGTSMACPHVSGVAALIVANYGGPGFTEADLKDMLLRSYITVDGYQTSAFVTEGLGNGLVRTDMMNLTDPKAAPGQPGSVFASTQEGVEQTLFLSIADVPADATPRQLPVASFRVSYAPADGSGEVREVIVPNYFSVGESLEAEINGLAHETTYRFEVVAVDRFGNVSQAVNCEGTTIEHANRSPQLAKPLEPMTLPENGSFEGRLDLSEYFTDPDLPNDKLTFSAESEDPSIAEVTVEENILVVSARMEGSVIVSITATDLAGAAFSRNMRVNVKETPVTPPGPDEGGDGDQEDTTTLGAGLTLYPNPVETTVTVGVAGANGNSARMRIYDGAARLVLEVANVVFDRGTGEQKDRLVYDLTALAPGAYTMTLQLDNGQEYHRSFMKR